MIMTLHEKQRVSVGSHVRFQHLTEGGEKYEVVLNKRQFLNLNDLIDELSEYPSLCYFPLGAGLWLYHKRSTTKLIDNRTNTFFSFIPKAWYHYISHVHASIYNQLCDGKSYHYQPHAKYETQPSYHSRRSASRLSQHHQTLSRSTRNARYENGKQSQHATLSRRENTDSRARARHGGGKYASRTDQEIETDQRDAVFSSDSSDSIESCNECSVEEGSVSPEDKLE